MARYSDKAYDKLVSTINQTGNMDKRIFIDNENTMRIPDGTYEILEKIDTNILKANTVIFINSTVDANNITADNVVFIKSELDITNINAKNVLYPNNE